MLADVLGVVGGGLKNKYTLEGAEWKGKNAAMSLQSNCWSIKTQLCNYPRKGMIWKENFKSCPMCGQMYLLIT